jgi:ankyrin repeat protein
MESQTKPHPENSTLELWDAIQTSDHSKFHDALSCGADIFARNPQNRTATMLAIHLNNFDFANTLIEMDGHKHVPNKDINTLEENTLCHLASKPLAVGLLLTLLDRGENPNQSQAGDTPLHIALRFHNHYAAKNLIAAGANLKSENYAKLQPIHEALCAGDPDSVYLLLERGIQFPKTGDGIPCLHLVAMTPNGSKDIVNLLLKSGQNPTEKDQYGLLPADYAQENNPHLISSLSSIKKPTPQKQKDQNSPQLSI